MNTTFMLEAWKLANLAALQGEVPIGAVIVQEHQIIGSGYNQKETHQNPLLHAEMIAIQTACVFLKNWRLTNCILICTLEPCCMCAAALREARIKGIIYGAKNPKGGAFSLQYTLHQDKRMNHQFWEQYEPFAPSVAAIKEFFAQKR